MIQIWIREDSENSIESGSECQAENIINPYQKNKVYSVLPGAPLQFRNVNTKL